MSRQREKHPYYVVGSIGDRNAKKYDCEHPNTYSQSRAELMANRHEFTGGKTMELSEYASKLRELADIIEERDKKYVVRVIDNEYGFLNQDRKSQEYLISTSSATDLYQTTFTKTEIEDLKINPALKAINWDEVKLIPVD